MIRLARASKSSFHRRWQEYPISADQLPKSVKLAKGKDLPDYIHESCIGKLVSQRLRDLIVEVEALGNGYSLFPVEINFPDGTRYPDQYYLWDVYRIVDAVDPSLGGVITVAGPVDGKHSWTYIGQGQPRSRETLALKKQVIKDMVAWNDLRFGHYNHFISDELFDQMKAHDMTGFSANSEWSEI